MTRLAPRLGLFFFPALLACAARSAQVRDPESPSVETAPAPGATKPPASAARETMSETEEPAKGQTGNAAKPGENAVEETNAPASATPAEPEVQTIALPMRLPLAVVRDELEKRLPARYAHGWMPVTAPGKNPRLEARITVWRDAIGLRIEGDVVHVELPLRYAADVRGKAKTPFGKSVSLAKGQTWGTRAEPQRVTLRGRARVEISRTWELGVSLELDAPQHGPPPEGNLCTAGSFRLCVSKASIAPLVREQLDAEITKRLRQAERTIKRHARNRVKLPTRMKEAWAMLGCPIPLDPGVKLDCKRQKARKQATKWLLLDPVAADVSYHGEGDALIVEVHLSARIRHAVGNVPPHHEVRPLPPRGAPPATAAPIDVGPGFDVEALRKAVRERFGP